MIEGRIKAAGKNPYILTAHSFPGIENSNSKYHKKRALRHATFLFYTIPPFCQEDR